MKLAGANAPTDNKEEYYVDDIFILWSDSFINNI